jgi:hypothetical protein
MPGGQKIERPGAVLTDRVGQHPAADVAAHIDAGPVLDRGREWRMRRRSHDRKAAKNEARDRARQGPRLMRRPQRFFRDAR